ncbi:transcriptional activator DEMETER [Quillaja saponaria]|uniref:Transcriptional activator DEMETER n=1 Tax=Quillaja saponaria TaxID=32244 RepID=A0AAD7Q4Z2_QUISA|nr:transcriptional activator DEMETER [Quillaja saponaria]
MKETRGAALQIYPTPVDEITCQLEGLNLSGRNISSVQEQNALVPYKGNGSIVPYEGFEFIKKRKPRPKVDLDPETDRIWKLLMGKEGSEGLEGNDKEKEKWWEEERKIFRGRADSFIARMHLVQGDRRFSRWKGSVVDSVVGVFLTQNVSDHLSSSAFMSLAARFPLMSTNDDNVGTNILVEEPEVCIINPDDTVMPLGRLLSQETFTRGFVTLHDTTENWREKGTSGTSTSPVQQHGESTEELISSEDSFNSSIIQGTGGIKSCSECTSEAEGPTTGCKSNKAYALPSNLLQVQKVTMFRDFYNSVNGGLLFDDRNKDGHMQYISHAKQNTRTDSRDSTSCRSTITYPIHLDTSQMQAPAVASSDYQLNDVDPGAQKLMSFETFGEESMSSWLQTSSALYKATDRNFRSLGIRGVGGSESTGKQNKILGSQELQMMNPYGPLSKHLIHPENISQSRLIPSNTPPSSNLQNDGKKILQLGDTSFPEPVSTSPRLDKRQNDGMRNSQMQDFPCFPKYTETNIDIEERTSAVNKQTQLDNILAEQKSTEQVYTSSQTYNEKNVKVSKANKMKAESEKKNVVDWDNLRKQVQKNGTIERRSKDTMDSLDYETLRHANVGEIANAIKERGMNNMLAERIKDFLNRLVRDHGSINLEWLRDVPPDKSKDYLLSIRGLGLKSVECVRLLTLHHLAFPVDTNVGRIAVRLGWVPLQPLPESLQLHLLELYPVLESIQKYLWPRLCKFDQRTLYELHYQMITFGKVFCTKNKPNCNACPMRAECRHFASAFASARLALPGPEEKSIKQIQKLENASQSLKSQQHQNQECIRESDIEDIEDLFGEDPDEIPTIKLNMGEFQMNLQSYMQENMELQEGDMSKALVSLSQEAASIPTPKLKNVSRLRTEHQVYELPDSHPLLEKMDRREPDDPSPYLLAIWTPGETANSVEPSERSCGAQDSSNLCNEKTCFSCNSIREANSQVVRGTLLIPCRTATRGSFPLNGTYFQVNEVFADHDSSQSPIDVPRAWIWNLPRRTVYFGTSVSTIFKGLTTQGIQHCFWRGFVCVRGFDQKTRAPRPLTTRFHFPASKIAKRRNEN